MTNPDPAFAYRAIFGPVYPASKTALNALTVAMALELEPEGMLSPRDLPRRLSTDMRAPYLLTDLRNLDHSAI
jgi:hypothetical protein